MKNFFSKIRNAWNKLQIRFLMWRTQRILDQIDRKVAKSIELKKATARRNNNIA